MVQVCVCQYTFEASVLCQVQKLTFFPLVIATQSSALIQIDPMS